MHLLKESHHSNEESSSRSALPGLRSHSFSITAASLLQVLSNTKLDPPFESITPECQRMENFWMNQCVTASPGSGLMKNNDPSKTKHGTRRWRSIRLLIVFKYRNEAMIRVCTFALASGNVTINFSSIFNCGLGCSRVLTCVHVCLRAHVFFCKFFCVLACVLLHRWKSMQLRTQNSDIFVRSFLLFLILLHSTRMFFNICPSPCITQFATQRFCLLQCQHFPSFFHRLACLLDAHFWALSSSFHVSEPTNGGKRVRHEVGCSVDGRTGTCEIRSVYCNFTKMYFLKKLIFLFAKTTSC